MKLKEYFLRLILIFFSLSSFGQKVTISNKIKEIDSLIAGQRVYLVQPIIDSLLKTKLPINQELHLKTCKLICLVHIEKLETALIYSNEILENTDLKGDDLVATKLQKGLIFGLLNRLDEMKVELDFVENYYQHPKIDKNELYGEYFIRLATWYRAKGLTADAISYSEKAIAFGKQNKYNNVEAVGLVLTALYKYNIEDSEYESFRLRALQNLKKKGNFHAMSWVYTHLYFKYKKDNEINKALTYLDSSLIYGKKVKYFRNIAYDYKILSEYFEGENQDDKALNYYKLYKQASDSSALQVESRKVEEIQSKYNFEKIEQESKVVETKRRNTTYVLVLVLIILIITISGFINIKQKNKRIQTAEEKIKERLKEKEFLLRELNHRVKNNLTLILSLVKFQYDKIENNINKDKFIVLENRIRTIAFAHEQLLYDNYNRLNKNYDLENYISKIADALINIATHNIEFNLSASKINLNIDTFLPIGIMVNELMSNTIKYAVFNDILIIDITIKKEGNKILLNYKDSGKIFKNNKNKSSLGITIINSMVKQLKGSLKRDKSEYTILLQVKN